MALTVGARLGSYEIVAPLGAGGMGEVYRAHDAKLNRDVAIKGLLPAVANDPDRPLAYGLLSWADHSLCGQAGNTHFCGSKTGGALVRSVTPMTCFISTKRLPTITRGHRST